MDFETDLEKGSLYISDPEIEWSEHACEKARLWLHLWPTDQIKLNFTTTHRIKHVA